MVGEDFRSQVVPVVKTRSAPRSPLGEHGPGVSADPSLALWSPSLQEDGPFPVCGYVARVVCPW